MPKPLKDQCLVAFQERLCREGYSDIAAQLPEIYAALGPRKGRKRVDLLRRRADRLGPQRVDPDAPAGNNSFRRVSSAKYLRLWLRRHPVAAPVPDPSKFQEVSATAMPPPIDHLPAWEFDLVRRMVFTQDYWFFLYLEPMWHDGKMRRAGQPLLDVRNRVHTFVHKSRARCALQRIVRASFIDPPLALIRFAEARPRYDPDTRLINTGGLNPEIIEWIGTM